MTERGSRSQWRTHDVIAAFNVGRTTDDEDVREGCEERVATLITDQSVYEAGEVVWHLLMVVGGMVQGIADHSGSSLDAVLSGALQQFAAITDDPSARAARAALTGLSSGDPDLHAFVLDELGGEGVELVDVTLHLLHMSALLASAWAAGSGEPEAQVWRGVRLSLGTEDPTKRPDDYWS